MITFNIIFDRIKLFQDFSHDPFGHLIFKHDIFCQKILGSFSNFRKIDRRMIVLFHNVPELQFLQVEHAKVCFELCVLFQQKLNLRFFERKSLAVVDLDYLVHNQILLVWKMLIT